jgi:RNA polymerase sigma factor (sigma-70 family)
MSKSAARMVAQHLRDLHGSGTLIGFTDGQLLAQYAALNDGLAFESLLARHGSMVAATCRAILEHEHDVEDAFQATFLVLARKARSVRAAGALGGWLHRVAYRIAVQAKKEARKRQRLESELAAMRMSDATRAGSEIEFHSVIHEEIERLPERERLPVVLCDLEGLTYEQAALRLRCTKQAVCYRLAKARTRLRDRLRRRGVTATAPGAGMTASHASATAALPVAWKQAAVSAATGGPTRAAVASLAQTMLRGMLMTQLKITSVAVLAATTLASFGVVALRGGQPNRPLPPASSTTAVLRIGPRAPRGAASPMENSSAQPSTTPRASGEKTGPPSDQSKETAVTVRGRVLGPDGRPVTGAKLYQTDWEGRFHSANRSSESATSGPDGRFQFTVTKGKWNEYSNQVAAAAPDLGVGWVVIPAGGKTDNLTVQLVDDGVPITGQIVDLQGKPVEGATLRVTQIHAAPGEDPGPWLEAVKRENSAHQWIEGRYQRIEDLYLPRTVAPSLEVTSDAEGRIRLTGIGRNRLVTAQLDGTTVVTEHLHILTRPGEPISVRTLQIGPPSVTTYYGSSFRHVAAPTRPITGVVRDMGTKKPLAGFTIRSHSFEVRPNDFQMVDNVQTTTDAEGRYRLIGMPKGMGYRIVAVPPFDQPYVPSTRKMPDTPGLDALTLDIELKRAVWITGKITDKLTGRPIPGANVEYFTFYSNPNHSDYEGFPLSVHWHTVKPKDDGTYRVAGLPGPGLVAVHAAWETGYLRSTDRDDEEWADNQELKGTSPMAITHPDNYCELARVDPPKNVESVTRDITLDPGWDVSGTVLAPNGRPMAEARGCVFNVNGSPGKSPEQTKGAAFTVRCSNPPRPLELLIHHPEKGLVGIAQTPENKGDSITVQLQLGATVTGRLLDVEGRPRADAGLKLSFQGKEGQVWHRYSPQDIKTDRDGRFSVTALLPGRNFRLSDDERELNFGDGLRSGHTKDLGGVRLTDGKK